MKVYGIDDDEPELPSGAIAVAKRNATRYLAEHHGLDVAWTYDRQMDAYYARPAGEPAPAATKRGRRR